MASFSVPSFFPTSGCVLSKDRLLEKQILKYVQEVKSLEEWTFLVIYLMKNYYEQIDYFGEKMRFRVFRRECIQTDEEHEVTAKWNEAAKSPEGDDASQLISRYDPEFDVFIIDLETYPEDKTVIESEWMFPEQEFQKFLSLSRTGYYTCGQADL